MDRIQLATCVVDLRLEQIHRDAETLSLTSREVAMLRYLAERSQQPVSREELLTEVWEFSSTVISRAVDTAMRRLRGKIEADPANPRHLITIHGFGYRFEPLHEVPTAPTRWTPAGCPSPSPDAQAFLSVACQRAEDRGDGFVGLEHLLLALDGHTVQGRAPSHARSILRSGRFETRMGQLVRASDDREPDWSGTPRLQALASGLSPGFGVDDLWQVIVDDDERGLQGIDLERSLLEAPPEMWGRRSARGLQVTGGPEDGRRIFPGEGEWLGRAWPGRDLDHGLYAGCVLEDATISRGGDLQWLGVGRVLLRRGGIHYKWDPAAFLPGATRGAQGEVLIPREVPGETELSLSAGDLLCLHATVLRALH
jgi:DNA-binding winged helix-turn-helix (wHTH) protein